MANCVSLVVRLKVADYQVRGVAGLRDVPDDFLHAQPERQLVEVDLAPLLDPRQRVLLREERRIEARTLGTDGIEDLARTQEALGGCRNLTPSCTDHRRAVTNVGGGRGEDLRVRCGA